MRSRLELLHTYANNFSIHSRMWEAEWNRQNKNNEDLTYAQYLILEMLQQEGPLQSKDLVNYFSITSGGITVIANKLLSREIIRRTKDEHKDRRAAYLEITEKGREVLKTLQAVRDRTFEKIFFCLTDAEIAILEQLYGKLIQVRKSNA